MSLLLSVNRYLHVNVESVGKGHESLVLEVFQFQFVVWIVLPRAGQLNENISSFIDFLIRTNNRLELNETDYFPPPYDKLTKT